jgi:hypothetical protein
MSGLKTKNAFILNETTEEQLLIDNKPVKIDEEPTLKWVNKLHILDLANFNEKIIPLKVEKSDRAIAALQLLLIHKETSLVKNYFIKRIQYVLDDKVLLDNNIYCYNNTE